MKQSKRKILLGIALGVFFSFCLMTFALGYFIYSLLPSFDNLQIRNQLGSVSGKVLTPECQDQLATLAEEASLWDLFQMQKWTENLTSECFLEITPEPERRDPEPRPSFESQDSEVI